MTDASASPYPVIPLLVPDDVGRVASVRRFLGAHTAGVPLRPALAALAVGGFGALAVVGHEPGLGAALVTAALWLPAVPTLVRRRAFSVLVTAGIGVALAAMVAVRSAEWVVVLCLLGAVGTCAVAATSARTALGIGLAMPTAPLAAVRAADWGWRGLAGSMRGRRGQLVRWLRTGVVTAVLLLVFGSLLASADAVFATLMPDLDLGELPARVIVGALVALAALAVVSLAVERPEWSTATLPAPARASRGEWFTPVLALAALMTAFLATQLVTLIGGDDYVRSTAGLTYATYARQGFGQLVAVTALTLLVVAWFAVRAPRGGPHDAWSTRAGLGAVCLAAVGVVVVALGRMSLYVTAYGLTELRLLATTGEIVMGVVLLLVLVAGVRWRGGWLPLAAVRVAAVALLALAIANPDALMVRYNTQAQEAPVDIWHLSGLSADAVPAIDALDEPLRSCLLASQDPDVAPSIWGWNLARARAAELDDVASASC
jgi:hypothetical protein